MKEIKLCEVCEESDLIPSLNLGKHPLCDDLVPFGEKRDCEEYPIEILYCPNCYTAHQRYQVDKELLFHKNYHYRARMTGSVLTGMSDLVENCVKRFGDLKDKLVLDIGCNDGSLLDFFRKKKCKTIGVEPTDAAQEADHPVYQCYFDQECATRIVNDHGSPDFITFTNVFAHINDLRDLISNLRALIKKESIIVIENHYLGAILDTGQFDTFYHEHPRTYSRKSFEVIAKKLGLELLDDQYVSRYGGNIRAYLGVGQPLRDRRKDESLFLNDFKSMATDVKDWIHSTKQLIEELNSKYGKLRAKAFPGRAAILIKMLGLSAEEISAVYEIKGSIKVNHFVPGTRIPILPEADLYGLDDQELPILNLAWHIPGEVRANLMLNGYKGEVIDIKPMNAGD
jgi:SAM-dependent methyltransferase